MLWLRIQRDFFFHSNLRMLIFFSFFSSQIHDSSNWTLKIVNGRGWPRFVPKYFFLKLRMEKYKEKSILKLRKITGFCTCKHLHLSALFVDQLLQEIVGNFNCYKYIQRAVKATLIYFLKAQLEKNIFKHGFASICRALK